MSNSDYIAAIRRLANKVEEMANVISDKCECDDDPVSAKLLDQCSDRLFRACVDLEKAANYLKDPA